MRFTAVSKLTENNKRSGNLSTLSCILVQCHTNLIKQEKSFSGIKKAHQTWILQCKRNEKCK